MKNLTENTVTTTPTATVGKPKLSAIQKAVANLTTAVGKEQQTVPPNKEAWLDKLTLAVRANETATGWVKNLALDSLLFYSSKESFKNDALVIKRAIVLGLSEAEREAYNWTKKGILDSQRRKDVLDKIGKYFNRMLKYAYPPKDKTKKTKKTTDNAKKEVALEVLNVPLFATKQGLSQALNAVITGINQSEKVDYQSEAVIASLQQIIRSLV